LKTKKNIKSITALKEGHESWPSETKKSMEHTILEAEVSKLRKDEEVMKYELGLKDLDKEIEASISNAEMELKAVQIKLEALRFDKVNNITKKRVKFQLEEARIESKRHADNVKTLKKRLDDGKPIGGVNMPEEPKVEESPGEKTPEEKETTEDKPKEPEDKPEDKPSEPNKKQPQEESPAA